MKKVAQIIVETLENFGVKRCYGVVGDTLNEVTDAMHHHTDIEWVHMRHEEVGGFAAGAEAFMTKNLTACAGSCGPGSLHFINGLFESHRNGSPVILIASQLPISVLGTNFPQEVDYKPIYQSCSVFCEEIKTAAEAKRVVMSACQAAINENGVAVVIIPSDISGSKVEDLPIMQQYQPEKPLIHPNITELKKVADLLNQGEKVGVFAGIGCAEARDEVMALCEKLEAPLVHTSRAKDFLEGDNPYDIGMTGMLGHKSGYQMIDHCDTLLILGADFAWSQFYPQHAKIIQIDIDAKKLGLRHAIDLGVIGNIKETLEYLLPLLTKKTDKHFLQTYQEMYQENLVGMSKKAIADSRELIHPQYLTELLSKHADHDAILTGDGGSAMVWGLRHFKTNGKRRTLFSMKHGTMANAMPQAIGLQKAYPQRQIISLSGDGGLTMLMGDLLTLVQERLPVKVVILNNGTLDFVELEMKVEGIVDNYTNLENPDFAKMAEAIGIKGFKVTNPHDLENVVVQFLKHEGPAILDVHTGRFELIFPPHTTPSNYSNMALYGAKAIIDGRGDELVGMLRDNFLRK